MEGNTLHLYVDVELKDIKQKIFIKVVLFKGLLLYLM